MGDMVIKNATMLFDGGGDSQKKIIHYGKGWFALVTIFSSIGLLVNSKIQKGLDLGGVFVMYRS